MQSAPGTFCAPRAAHASRHASAKTAASFFTAPRMKKPPFPGKCPGVSICRRAVCFPACRETPCLFYYHTTLARPAAHASYTKKRLCFRQFARNRGICLFRGIMRGGRQHTAILHRAPCCRTAPSAGEYPRAGPCAQSPRRRHRTPCRE